MKEMIEAAQTLHAAIIRFQHNVLNNLTVQGWIADTDDLLEELFQAKEDMDNGPNDKDL